MADRAQIALPPTLVRDGGVNTVVTFSDVINYEPSDDTDSDAIRAPDEIAARMLGPHRIQEQLEDTAIQENFTCGDLNYVSI